MSVARASWGVRAVWARAAPAGIERSTVVRAVVIAALLALVLLAVPEVIDLYWLKNLTAVAI